MTRFTDAYATEEGGRRFFCYRTGMTVYEEMLEGSRGYAVGWGVSGYPPQTATTGGVPRMDPHPYVFPDFFRIAVAGRELIGGYEFESFDTAEEDGVLHARLKLVRTSLPLAVTVHTLLDGTRALTRYLTLENRGEKALEISRITVMGGGIAQGNALPIDRAFRLGYMMDSTGACEGDYHEIDLPRNTFSFGRTNYFERFRIPFFCLQNRMNGTVMCAQLGFSGAYTFTFQNCSVYGGTCLSYSADVGATAPVLVLDPQEAFETPRMHVCVIPGSPDDAFNEMNDHFRIFNREFEKTCVLESGIGPEVDMSQEMVLAGIDRAAAFGAEVFYLDASWYAPPRGEEDWSGFCGTWEPEECRYPIGIEGIRDYARSKGLKFGLWVDCEKIGPRSVLWDAEYPPKLVGYDGGYTIDGASRVADISVPEGLKWAEDTICGLIERYDLDFFRLDSGAYSFASVMDHAGIPENRDLRYYANWYALFKRLRKKYPHVIFQNCAGGGARIDAGMLQPMSNTWITDQQVAPMSYRVINGCSMLLPMEYMVRGIGGQNVHVAATLDFQLNVARFGNPVFSYHIPEWVSMNEAQADKIKRMLRTYKEVLRPALPGCRVFHHTPVVDEHAPDSAGILELAAKDRTVAMIGVFTLTKPENPEFHVRFRGLSYDLPYEVTVNDAPVGRMSGYALSEIGFTVRIDGALDSRAIIARAVPGGKD